MKQLITLILLCCVSITTQAQFNRFQFSPSFGMGGAAYTGDAIRKGGGLMSVGIMARLGADNKYYSFGCGIGLYNVNGRMSFSSGQLPEFFYGQSNSSNMFFCPHFYYQHKVYKTDKSHVYLGADVGGAIEVDGGFYNNGCSGLTGVEAGWVVRVSRVLDLEINEHLWWGTGLSNIDLGWQRRPLQTYMLTTCVGIRMNRGRKN